MVELSKVGLFTSDLINGRRYWSKFVKDKKLKTHLKDIEVESAGARPKILSRQYFSVILFKDLDYATNLMSSYATTNMIEGTSTKLVYKYEIIYIEE